MSDWKVGDLAVAVSCQGPCPYCDSDGGFPDGDMPAVGQVYEVAAIQTDPYWSGVHGIVGLGVGSYGFVASCGFRKIRPDEHEACEEEFKILLKLSKKRVSAALSDGEGVADA